MGPSCGTDEPLIFSRGQKWWPSQAEPSLEGFLFNSAAPGRLTWWKMVSGDETKGDRRSLVSIDDISVMTTVGHLW